ncbi:DUF3099 domain-containing protein [Streptomyces sp. TP-A0874]|uniref:DUF3099 domain-containing protein n=1 Tax=Streptomyces sp. TP-A0874 TaxID=549819 RepID=UPI0008534BBB|nr:DUF3099 domain-containing protein [Streptomyces sp. TP-A0874]
MTRKQPRTEIFRITGARRGLAEDVRARQRRYTISMLVRTASVLGAAALWDVERHLAVVALLLGVVLPYVAVVIANAGRENATSLPSTHIPPVRGALPAAGDASAAPGPEAAEGPEADRPEDGANPSA